MLNVIAGVVVLDVFAVYIYCLRLKGVYPPSHPWSGISLVFLSGAIVLGARQLDRVNPTPPWVVAGGLLLSAGLWTFAALKTP